VARVLPARVARVKERVRPVRVARGKVKDLM
jgi:hypothetical protein